MNRLGGTNHQNGLGEIGWRSCELDDGSSMHIDYTLNHLEHGSPSPNTKYFTKLDGCQAVQTQKFEERLRAALGTTSGVSEMCRDVL